MGITSSAYWIKSGLTEIDFHALGYQTKTDMVLRGLQLQSSYN